MSGALGTQRSRRMDGLWLTGLEDIFCRHSSSLEVENPDLCPVWPAGQVSMQAVKYHRRHLLLPLSSPLMTCTDQTPTLDPHFHPSKGWKKETRTQFFIHQSLLPLSWEKVLCILLLCQTRFGCDKFQLKRSFFLRHKKRVIGADVYTEAIDTFSFRLKSLLNNKTGLLSMLFTSYMLAYMLWDWQLLPFSSHRRSHLSNMTEPVSEWVWIRQIASTSLSHLRWEVTTTWWLYFHFFIFRFFGCLYWTKVRLYLFPSLNFHHKSVCSTSYFVKTCLYIFYDLYWVLNSWK